MRQILDKKKKGELFSLFLLAFGLLFYLFFAFYDGAVICVDSPTYIHMDLAREPFYSLFLAALRALFRGDPLYLQAAVVLQSILAAFSAWSMARFLQKTFALPRPLTFLLFCIPLAVSLLCRFVAGRSSMYSNSILTEGICIPLWLLLFRFLLDYCFSGSKKSLWSSVFLCFLMISTRKQMLACLPLLAFSLLYVSLRRAEKKRKGKALLQGLSKSLLAGVLILLCVSLFDRSYNLALRGEFVRHSSDNRFLATMVVYTANRQDADYIQDEAVRGLFLSIYDTCEEGGFLGSSAGSGWLARVTHFGDHYDHIQIDTLWPMVRAYANEQVTDAVEQEFSTDRIMDTITGSLLPHTYPRVLAVLFDNLLSGLVTTVAQRTPILILYTLLIYPIYLALSFLVWKKGGDRRILVFSALTLAGILVNVTAVSAVIFCQTRYTIYNMSLFYSSGLLLLWESLRLLWQGSHKIVAPPTTKSPS